MKQTIFIAFRNSIRTQIVSSLLLTHPQYKVIGHHDSCEQIENFIVNKRPDIAIIDEDVDEINGLAIAQKIQSLTLKTKVVILTANSEKSRLRTALEYGVLGYFSHKNLTKQILACLDTISLNKHFIDTAMFKIKERPTRKPKSSTFHLINTQHVHKCHYSK